jgi:antitoxin HicB
MVKHRIVRVSGAPSFRPVSSHIAWFCLLWQPNGNREGREAPGGKSLSMARELTYTLLLRPEPEDGGFSVTVPALPEVATQGETWEEAVGNAHEAIELALSYRQEQGEEIPEDVPLPKLERIHVTLNAA